jgi:mono/diheme cytochrome c family protein
MHHKGWIAFGVIVAVVVALIVFGLTQFSISALPEPGGFETSVATRAKDWYISRAVHGQLPSPPKNSPASIAAGNALFGMDCASCHGQDGRTPTPIGKSMYPRALDLSSREVQQMSDRELFWVIKNGIRLSGMPGFARINSDQEIWELTYYVRSLKQGGR